MTLDQFLDHLKQANYKWVLVGDIRHYKPVKTLRVRTVLRSELDAFRSFCPITAVEYHLRGEWRKVSSFYVSADKLNLSRDDTRLIIAAADDDISLDSLAQRIRYGMTTGTFEKLSPAVVREFRKKLLEACDLTVWSSHISWIEFRKNQDRKVWVEGS